MVKGSGCYMPVRHNTVRILQEFGPYVFGVYMVLYRHSYGYDAFGVAVSLPELARLTGMGRKVVRESIDTLIKANLVVKRRIGRRGDPNMYMINILHPDVLENADPGSPRTRL